MVRMPQMKLAMYTGAIHPTILSGPTRPLIMQHTVAGGFDVRGVPHSYPLNFFRDIGRNYRLSLRQGKVGGFGNHKLLHLVTQTECSRKSCDTKSKEIQALS